MNQAIDTLDALLIQLEQIDDELREYEKAYDTAEQTFELAEARAALGTNAANAEKRKAEVTMTVEKESWQMKVAKRQLKVCLRRYGRQERAIDIQRTREANQRGGIR